VSATRQETRPALGSDRGEDTIALTYSPGVGLRLELPNSQLPIELDGVLLAAVFFRLSQDTEWAEELKHWTMAQLPAMSMN
jgi:hypothetical protein